MEVVEARHLWLHNRSDTGPLSVSGETCPHYLLLVDTDLERLGPVAKCAPPLRGHDEVERLKQQLLSGGIDIVASDHSPAPQSLKESDDVFDVWGGISGVQSTLPALLTIDVPPQQAATLTATNAARRFAIAGKGEIAVGFDADLTLVDVDAAYTLTRDMLLDRHKLSPYVGRTFRGRVKRTILRGQTIFRDGQIVGASRGRLVTPARGGVKSAGR
jgi:allantoinase